MSISVRSTITEVGKLYKYKYISGKIHDPEWNQETGFYIGNSIDSTHHIFVNIIPKHYMLRYVLPEYVNNTTVNVLEKTIHSNDEYENILQNEFSL